MKSMPGGSQRRRCVLVVNPTSSGGRAGQQWSRVSHSVRSQLEAAALEVDEHLTTHAGHAIVLAKQAVAEGADVVAAVGGDGTVHEVVQGLMEAAANCSVPLTTAGGPALAAGCKSSTALAVVPFGTGNDFIKTFGWDTSMQAAVDRIISVTACPIDVGAITLQSLPNDANRTTVATSDACTAPGSNARAMATVTRWFVNVASAGASAAAVQLVPRYSRCFGSLAYSLASALALLSWRNVPAEVSIDGAAWEPMGALALLALGNGSTFGQGMRIAPGADPCDGKLLAVAVANAGVLHFLRHLGALKAGKHLHLDIVRSFPFQKLQVRAADSRHNSRLAFELDGTIAGCCPASVSVVPGALMLLGGVRS